MDGGSFLQTVAAIACPPVRAPSPIVPSLDNTVQPCNCAIVNVTIKLDDALCREARHRAVDADLSLSGWIAELIHERLGLAPVAKRPKKTLLEMLGDEKAGATELEIPPLGERPRPADLED